MKNITKKQLQKACDEARERVSGYSKEKRAELLESARETLKNQEGQLKGRYPFIDKLGIPVYLEGNCPYVLSEDIRKVLNKEQMKIYSNLFGAQTGICTKDGKCGSYPSDVNSCLERVLTGKRTGSQLLWD